MEAGPRKYPQENPKPLNPRDPDIGIRIWRASLGFEAAWGLGCRFFLKCNRFRVTGLRFKGALKACRGYGFRLRVYTIGVQGFRD